jgi:hypothetical protein
MKYYNGVVFKGFINGVPGSVLSGGRYDKLMARLHDNSKAIGFAVYLDMLEDINKEEKEYDADIMLVYSPGSDPAGLREAADKLTAEGKSVFVAAEGNQSVRCREIYKYADGEVRSLSTWDINPLESSHLSASSSCVRFFATLSSFILGPIFIHSTPFLTKSLVKLNFKTCIIIHYFFQMSIYKKWVSYCNSLFFLL